MRRHGSRTPSPPPSTPKSTLKPTSHTYFGSETRRTIMPPSSPPSSPDVTLFRIKDHIDVLAYFERLDLWLENPAGGESIGYFLEPMLEIVRNAEPGRVTSSMKAYIAHLFLDSDLEKNDERLRKYKPFFHEICGALYQTIFQGKGMLPHLQRKASEKVISPLQKQFVSQVDKTFPEVERREVIIPILTRIHSYLIFLYEAAYGEEALDEMLKEVSSEQSDSVVPIASEGVKAGVCMIVGEWARIHLLEKFSAAIARLHTQEEWENRDFMEFLTQFLKSKNPSFISQFIGSIFYILSRFEMGRDNPIGADDIPEIYEAVIEVTLAVKRENIDIKTLSAMMAMLRILEEMLSEEIFTDEGELMGPVISQFIEMGQKKFEENRLRYVTEVSDTLEGNMESLVRNYFRRVLDFVRLLSKKISHEIAQREQLHAPLTQGLSKLGEQKQLTREMNTLVTFVFDQLATTGKWKTLQQPTEEALSDTDSLYEGELHASGEIEFDMITKNHISRVSLGVRVSVAWRVFKEKYKKVHWGWKVGAGAAITLTLIGIVLAAVLCPPSLVVSGPLGAVAVAAIAGGGGGALIAITATAHVVHIANQNVSDEELNSIAIDSGVPRPPSSKMASFANKSNGQNDSYGVARLSLGKRKESDYGVARLSLGEKQGSDYEIARLQFGTESEDDYEIAPLSLLPFVIAAGMHQQFDFPNKTPKKEEKIRHTPPPDRNIRRHSLSSVDIFGEGQRKSANQSPQTERRPRSEDYEVAKLTF